MFRRITEVCRIYRIRSPARIVILNGIFYRWPLDQLGAAVLRSSPFMWTISMPFAPGRCSRPRGEMDGPETERISI